MCWPYAIFPDSNVDWPNVDPTSVLSSRRWANVIPTYIAFWLVRLWSGLPIQMTHTTEPAHHRAARLCAARWRAAMLGAIWLGCVEDHPWTRKYNTMCAQTLLVLVAMIALFWGTAFVTLVSLMWSNPFWRAASVVNLWRSHIFAPQIFVFIGVLHVP